MNARLLAAGVAAAAVFSVLAPWGSTAHAADPRYCGNEGCGGASAGDGVIRTIATKSDHVPRGNPQTHGQAPGRTSWLEIDEYMTPACPNNGYNGADALCTYAIASCPDGQIRWWIWHTTTQATRNDDGSVTRVTGSPQMLPGSYCLGSDDPGVPDYGRAIALVQSGFQDLPLPKADIEVAPAPRTLVNVPTAFYAGGAQTFSSTGQPLPGISVTVTARPTSWTWHWGDGTSRTFTTPGEPGKPVVSHVYSDARDHSAHVVVTWKGSFTIGGSAEVFDITSPVTVTSPPVTVGVRQARTELVAG